MRIVDSIVQPYTPPYGVNGTLEGIDHFGWTIIHESQHYADWATFWDVDNSGILKHQAAIGMVGPDDDKDDDRIPNKLRMSTSVAPTTAEICTTGKYITHPPRRDRWRYSTILKIGIVNVTRPPKAITQKIGQILESNTKTVLMKTKIILSALSIIMAITSAGFEIHAEPMDMKAAEMLAPIKGVVRNVKAHVPVPNQGVALLRTCLQSGDPVLISIAAWCVMQMGSQGDELQPDLANLAPKTGDMTYAFVTLAKGSRLARNQTLEERQAHLRALANSDNPILTVEAAKALVRIDHAAGRTLLRTLAQQSRGETAVEASRALGRLESSRTPQLPYSDEKYETVLSIVEEQPIRN